MQISLPMTEEAVHQPDCHCLPAGWRCRKLSHVITRIESGTSVNAEDRQARYGEIGVLKLSCIRDGMFDPAEHKTVWPHEESRVSAPVHGGTIIMSRKNTTELVGANAYSSQEIPGLYLSDLLWQLHVNQNEANPRWLAYLLASSGARKRISAQASGTSHSMKNIVKGQVLALTFGFPPLDEQACIVEILDDADAAVRATEKLIDAKIAHKRALAERLLIGRYRCARFIRSRGQHSINKQTFPLDWQSVEIGEISTQVNRRNPGGHSYPVLSCTKHSGLVLSSEYFGRRIHSEDLTTYKLVKRGQFAYATNHIEEGSIGLQDLCDVGLISPMYTVFAADKSRIDTRFLFALLKTEMYRHQFEAATNGTVNRRGSLRWPGFARIRIPLPTLEEQQYISAILELCDHEINLLRRQLGAQKQQKQALMQKLLTGALRVKEFRS